MRFEHLVQINDPLMPLLTAVTRGQLQRALRLRAERPTEFMPTLMHCEVEPEPGSAGRDRLRRRLDFGSFAVRDVATLVDPDHLRVDTAAGPTWPASQMTIRIEAPAPDALFLRFVYESDEAASGELDALTEQFRRQAYEAADLDMVVRIRELVEDGALGE